MTIRLIEGFDVYPDATATSQGMQARWVFPAGSGAYIVPGRFGGKAAEMQGNSTGFGYALFAAGGGSNTLCMGFAVQFLPQSSATLYKVLSLRNGGVVGTDVIGLGINTSNQLFVWVGNEGNVVATSAESISMGSWRYVDFQLTVGGSGSIAVYLDGVETMNFTGNTGAGSIDSVLFGPTLAIGGGGTLFDVDDVYVTDTTARLGERRVETLYPNANSAVAWTPLTGTNWQEVSEPQCDGDTSYVSTTVAGTQDTYAITSLASNPLTIDAVQVRVACRKDDGSSHVLNTVLNSQGTVSDGANFAIAGTYLYDIDVHPTDPDGGGAWTTARVNGALIGQKLVS